jgi:hypothetical protein
MYLTRGGSAQWLLTSGPRGWAVGQIPWPVGQVLCRFGRRPLHLAGRHVAWPAGRHIASYHLSQVVGAHSGPYKYPSTGGNQNTHHISEIPLAKLPFLV